MTSTETTSLGFDASSEFSSSSSEEASTSASEALSSGLFSDAQAILHRDHSNITENPLINTTYLWNRGHDFGQAANGLQTWQIILIACLSSAAVVIFIALVLIWKFCGKNSNVDPRAISGSNSPKKNKFVCCPGPLSDKKPSSPATVETGLRPSSAQKALDEYQQHNDTHRSMDPKAPLPPIGSTTPRMPIDQNVSLQSTLVAPRRLAPLGQHGNNTATTDLTGGTVVQQGNRRTGGVYGPLQQLKGVPMIPVPLEHRRPLPPPPLPPSA